MRGSSGFLRMFPCVRALSGAAFLAGGLLLSGCNNPLLPDKPTTGKIILSNGEYGCTVKSVKIAEKGQPLGDEMVQSGGIGYSSSGQTFEVAGDKMYTIWASSLETISNLSPAASTDVYVAKGATKYVTYSHEGGPSLYWAVLTVEN